MFFVVVQLGIERGEVVKGNRMGDCTRVASTFKGGAVVVRERAEHH